MLDCCRVSVGILLTSKKLRSCVDESLVRQLIRLATGTSCGCMVAARESDICALNRFKTQTQMVRVCARIGRSLEKWCHSERESGKNLGTLRPCVPNLRRSRVTVSGSRKHPFKQQDGICITTQSSTCLAVTANHSYDAFVLWRPATLQQHHLIQTH